MTEERKEKAYTIRGIDPSVYEAFSRMAKELNTSVGRLLNEAMRMMIGLVSIGSDIGLRLGKMGVDVLRESTEMLKTAMPSPDYEVITGVKELEVSKSDLENTEKPVLFLNLNRLVFADDVTWEIIDKKVKGIRLVDEVVVPRHIPKLLLAKKCSMVGRITVRA
jgi:hypothetical protein